MKDEKQHIIQTPFGTVIGIQPNLFHSSRLMYHFSSELLVINNVEYELNQFVVEYNSHTQEWEYNRNASFNGLRRKVSTNPNRYDGCDPSPAALKKFLPLIQELFIPAIDNPISRLEENVKRSELMEKNNQYQIDQLAKQIEELQAEREKLEKRIPSLLRDTEAARIALMLEREKHAKKQTEDTSSPAPVKQAFNWMEDLK